MERVKMAQTKKIVAKTEPSWDEVWSKIFQTKLSDNDKSRLMEVRQAIDCGELGTGVDSLRKFTKAHALRQYQALKALRIEKWKQEMVDSKPDNYHLVTDPADMQIIRLLLTSETYIGYDSETTGLDFKKDHIVGISLTLPHANHHYYIPMRHTTGEEQLSPEQVWDVLKPFLEDENLGKVGHNIKFDSHMLWKEGIDLKGIKMDTMIAFHVLNENEVRYALKVLATKYGRFFGFELESHTYEELFGKGGFQNTPFDIATVYACKDTHLSVEFGNWIQSFYDKQPELGKAYAIENELLNVIIQMERNGSLIDLEFGKQYADQLAGELADLSKQIYEILGNDFEFTSPSQLLAKLQAMGILTDRAKSVDADALERIKAKSPAIPMILKYRELAKLHSTYIVPLPNLVRPDGRLMGQFNQHTTVTTRLSSDSPNLQNIPPEARALFIAPAGKILVGIDLSQIEPRYLSHISGDKDFQEPYLTGKDLYSSLASKVFHLPYDQCGDGTRPRKKMKVGLLAVMYGVSDYSLGQQLGITTEEATAFMKDFMTRYPVTEEWIEQTKALVQWQQYVPIFGGYKRRFEGFAEVAKKYHYLTEQLEKKVGHPITNIWEEKLKYDEKRKYWDVAKVYFGVLRQAVNARIQGSCATILKMAMIKLHAHLKTKGEDWKILLQIHDELIFEVPDTASQAEIEELIDIMCNVVKLSVPIKADCEVMLTWGKGVPYKKWFAGERE